MSHLRERSVALMLYTKVVFLGAPWQYVSLVDQRSLMFSTGISKVLSLIFVRPSVRHITTTKKPCVLVLTRCHVTDINHVLTRCHVTEINYVDRGAAARAPLQLQRCCVRYLYTQ